MTTLLIVDPQNDFHDGGSLAVPGANEDALRTAAFIKKNLDKIDNVFVTMDTHHKLHIAHSAFWESGDGSREPDVFSTIKVSDIDNGVWLPKNRSLVDYCKSYIEKLEGKGRFQLCIWPEHCIQGSKGHAVTDTIFSALQKWIIANADKSKCVNYILKGQNCRTEMYSALRAEVPLEDDVSTQLNEVLKNQVLPASSSSSDAMTNQLIVCGQAMSHCVNHTLRDIIEGADHDTCNKITLMSDCCSAVSGFEDAADSFISDMRESGVMVKTSDETII